MSKFSIMFLIFFWNLSIISTADRTAASINDKDNNDAEMPYGDMMDTWEKVNLTHGKFCGIFKPCVFFPLPGIPTRPPAPVARCREGVANQEACLCGSTTCVSNQACTLYMNSGFCSNIEPQCLAGVDNPFPCFCALSPGSVCRIGQRCLGTGCDPQVCVLRPPGSIGTDVECLCGVTRCQSASYCTASGACTIG